MKTMRVRTRRLKTAVSVYGSSRRSRPDHCARKSRWSRIRVFRAVSRYSGGAPCHHYGLARIGNLEVFFVSLSLLFLFFVIIIKYSRAQRGTQASYPPSSSLSVALELNGYC